MVFDLSDIKFKSL